MISKHFQEIIAKHLKFTPTPSQEKLMELLSDFTIDDDDHSRVLVIKGYAGTGKTSTISAYVKALDQFKFKNLLLAPTGRAAKVLGTYCRKPASTIHRKIYRQKSSNDGFGKFELNTNLHSRTIFIVDEASMISNQDFGNSMFGTGKLLDDLVSFVKNGKSCRLILIGDTAQLPPVGLNLSPALIANQLGMLNLEVHELTLNDVVRQTLDSGILRNATQLRKMIADKNINYPIFQKDELPDFILLNGADLIEEVNNCYDKYGMEETIVVCRSNKRANRYNQGIRNTILYREEELTGGDLLMIVKNNYFWMQEYDPENFIANGDIVEIMRVHKHKELYGYRFAYCTIRLTDYDFEMEANVLLDVLTSDTAALTAEENKQLFYTILEDYADQKPRQRQYLSVRNNEFYNALQVKYANAITCHKAQGGQWKAVFVDAGYLTADMVDVEYLRWLYTAITRATEKVYLVNFPDFFFEKEIEVKSE